MSIATITKTVSARKNERYFSSTQDLDVGFGNYLLNILDLMREPETGIWSKSFCEYTKREKSKKLIFGSESDITLFYREMQERLSYSKENKTDLPMVYFFKDPSISYCDDDSQEKQRNYGTLVNEDNNTSYATIDVMPIVSTYTIVVVAWDKESLTKLAGGLMLSLMTAPRKINFNTSVLNALIEQNAVISPAQAMVWQNESIPVTEGRLFAMSTTVTISSNLYQAQILENSNVTITIDDPIVFGGGYGANHVGKK